MAKQKKEEYFNQYFEAYGIQDEKMTEQQRNKLFVAYLKQCIDTINQNTKAEKRAAILKNLHTIHETEDLFTACNVFMA